MNMKLLNPLFQSQIHCNSLSFKGFYVNAYGGLIHVRWEKTLAEKINSADEELIVEARRPSDGFVIIEKRCTNLTETEFYLDLEGDIDIRLVRKKKFTISLNSSFHYTPKVVIISENEGRHHLSWEDIDWDQVRREVELASGLDWGKDIRVYLFVKRWPADTGLKAEEWIPVDMADHALILGYLKEVSLVAAIDKDLGKEISSVAPESKAPFVLKNIFELKLKNPPEIEELSALRINIRGNSSCLGLKREIWEEPTLQLKAWWRIPAYCWHEAEEVLLSPQKLSWDDVDVCIRLYRYKENKVELWEPEKRNAVLDGDHWLFPNVPEGSGYQAALVVVPKGEKEPIGRPLLISNIVSIPERMDKIVLMPIDQSRAFAYWHLDRERLQKRIDEISGGAPEKVKTFIRVFHEWGGTLHHEMDKDIEVHLGISDNWYLTLEPDKVYRVQLIAVVDDSKVEPLTDVSNPAQTARVLPGSNPVVYRDVENVPHHPTHRELRSVMGTAHYSIGLEIIHLHAHLPYIRKRVVYGSSGVWQPLGFPAEWFHEAIRETYAPLIMVFERLRDEGVDFRLSMDISPTLSNMMRCPMLQEEFLKYMDAHISLARAEVSRTKREAPQYHETAWMHLNHFLEVKHLFLKYQCDLTKAFRQFQDEGYIEISTCAATHGFLPFYSRYPSAIRAQIMTAVKDYMATFGRSPIGIWLPECAYVPGIEKYLEEAGLRYFFTEAHSILLADCPNSYGTYAPVFLKGSDVAAFARDPDTGKQVWSGDEGYPGDPDYLEFHIKGGPLKYNRVTSRDGGQKEPYVRSWAVEKAANHAQHFMDSRNFKFNYIKNWFWKKPLVVATYDAELFGHHWYEGPDFLYFLFKKLYYNQNETELITPSEYLRRYPRNQEVFITPSSWGDKGTFDKWIYGSVSWMYRHTHEAIEELEAMAKDLAQETRRYQLKERIVKQALREVLQAMNSDIPFVISNGHFVDLMKQFFFQYLERFWSLASLYWNNGQKSEMISCALERYERENPIFPDLDLECCIEKLKEVERK